jgi:predicted DNA-binding transcriptional regulator AlpA
MDLMADYLDYDDVAALTNIKRDTLMVYQSEANRRRREGVSKPGDMPPPDKVFGASPAWKETTIEQWLARRPGRGVGGAVARQLKRERERYLKQQGIDGELS